jgi:hypothetical protein
VVLHLEDDNTIRVVSMAEKQNSISSNSTKHRDDVPELTEADFKNRVF